MLPSRRLRLRSLHPAMESPPPSYFSRSAPSFFAISPVPDLLPRQPVLRVTASVRHLIPAVAVLHGEQFSAVQGELSPFPAPQSKAYSIALLPPISDADPRGINVDLRFFNFPPRRHSRRMPIPPVPHSLRDACSSFDFIFTAPSSILNCHSTRCDFSPSVHGGESNHRPRAELRLSVPLLLTFTSVVPPLCDTTIDKSSAVDSHAGRLHGSSPPAASDH